MRAWLVLLAGCTNILPPPAAPAPIDVTPQVPLGDPPQGSSHVLIDSDQAAIVEDASAGFAYRGRLLGARLLCTATPCDTHLTQGPHVLSFSHPDGSWGGEAVVSVGQEPKAVRYALGHRKGYAAAYTGYLLALLGLPIGGSAAFFWALNDRAYANTASMANTEATVAVVGLAAGVLGLWLAATSIEVQNGAATQWTVAR
jgi:hypothetical protein